MRVLRLTLVGCLALVLLVPASSTGAATLSSSKAKRAVKAAVKRKFGSSYVAHPACYKVTSRRSRCFVHYVHNSKTCTNWATVRLRGSRAVVSVRRPSC
jgi:hypothetical protein